MKRKQHTMSARIKVEIGQQWQDNDKRGNGRIVEVEQIANCWAHVRNIKTGRRTIILLSRFNPNYVSGYTLVKESGE